MHDRLADAVRRKRTTLCVGLDPRWESLPSLLRAAAAPSGDEVAALYWTYCERVLELVEPFAAVVKPQSAFFEACGPAGMIALRGVIRRAKAMGLFVILDAKRGDIASTAIAYADAAFTAFDADALTVNPYLGADAVEPLIAAARKTGRGVFVLVRTSNPGAGLFQDLDCGGRTLYQAVGDEVRRWTQANIGHCGLGDVGAVVGATHPQELANLRTRMPDVWFLVPGYGAQGGSAADVRAALRPDGLGAVVNSSRGVMFPFKPEDPDWEAKVVEAARKAAAELAIE